MSENGVEILLIRHAEAGDRGRWDRPDPLRPLTEEGLRQARALAELFVELPLAHLLSSPFVRCVQTMEPLAAARGLPVETSDDLVEGRPWELVEKLALELAPEGPAAMCVHGDALKPLIAALRERGIHLDATNECFQKGSTWILFVRDGAIGSGRQVPAPDGSIGD